MINENDMITVPCDVYKLKKDNFWMIKNLIDNFDKQYDSIEISPRLNNYILHGVIDNKKVFLGFYSLSEISEDILKHCTKTAEYVSLIEAYPDKAV